jgi:hypothetical protein
VRGGEEVDVKKMLIMVVVALLLLVGAGVAYATNSAPDNAGTGDRGAQVAGQEDANEPGEIEDADEPGDVDGPGDTEDDD